MIQPAAGPQCLSARVSALADGSLPDDVRDRALAHVTSCPDCRADLEAERLVRARLQALPAPRPSESLMAALLAMGEPGGPVPPRPGHVPGSPRPRPAAIRREPMSDAPWRSVSVPSLPWQRVTPGRRSTSRSQELPARPGPTSRPGGRGAARRRTVVGATAGAVGAGVIAAALASGLPAAQRVVPPDEVRAQANVDAGAALSSSATSSSATSSLVSMPSASLLSLGAGTAQEAALVGGASLVLDGAGAVLDRASAVPGMSTTLLRQLVQSPPSDDLSTTSRSGVAAALSLPVSHRFAPEPFGSSGSLGSVGFLSGGYLAGGYGAEPSR